MKLENFCMPWGPSLLESNTDAVTELTMIRKMRTGATVPEMLEFNNIEFARLYLSLSPSYVFLPTPVPVTI